MYFHTCQRGAARIGGNDGPKVAAAPDIPTMQEAGLPEFDTYSLFGLFAPARTSADIIKKIHEDITKIIARPEVKRALETRSLDVQGKVLPIFRRLSIVTQ